MTSPFRFNQMMVDVRRRALPTCRCGHLLTDHTEEEGCNEPTGRCQCTQAVQVCTTCRHTFDKFDPVAGVCTAQNPGSPHRCGCTQTSEGTSTDMGGGSTPPPS